MKLFTQLSLSSFLMCALVFSYLPISVQAQEVGDDETRTEDESVVGTSTPEIDTVREAREQIEEIRKDILQKRESVVESFKEPTPARETENATSTRERNSREIVGPEVKPQEVEDVVLIIDFVDEASPEDIRKFLASNNLSVFKTATENSSEHVVVKAPKGEEKELARKLLSHILVENVELDRTIRETVASLPQQANTDRPVAPSEARERALTNEARQDRAEERASTTQEARVERVTSIVEAYVERTERRFLAAVERLETLASRIESRLEKIEADGGDATEAKRSLSEARSALTNVKGTIEKASALLKESIASESPSAGISEARTLYSSAKEDLRSAHTSLVEAITALKEGSERE